MARRLYRPRAADCLLLLAEPVGALCVCSAAFESYVISHLASVSLYSWVVGLCRYVGGTVSKFRSAVLCALLLHF